MPRVHNWVIYRQDNMSGDMHPYRPSVDGIPTVFGTRKAAMDYAYDALIAGERNSWTEYRREPEPPTCKLHNHEHPYTQCTCGHEYCARHYPIACPRCHKARK